MLQTPEERLIIIIGHAVIENVKLGFEVENLRAALNAERARSDAAEQLLRDMKNEKAP